MDEKNLLHACQLVDAGKFSEAYDEFIQLVENTPDPLEKAWPLIYAADTLQRLGQEEVASAQLSAARALIEKHRPTAPATNEAFAAAETFLDFEEANLLWLRGGSLEAALSRFEAVLKKHRLELKDSRARGLYEAIQTRRAFILADLGRWKEALPILEEIESPQEYKEGVAFYLGHCYLSAHDHIRAEQKLTEALSLGGLPHSLEYRAHCELGMTYYQLQNYAPAKRELEKCAATADKSYLKDGIIWKYLEATCRALGLKGEAEHYASLARPS
jgi:tetratricopeptide (TPR) repeat protein